MMATKTGEKSVLDMLNDRLERPSYVEPKPFSDAAVTDFYKPALVRADMDYFEPSLTRQEFAAECDINTIMAQYEKSGVISHVNRASPMYLDTTLYPDLQGSMDAFREASLAFNALPAAVRKEFDNDPEKFVKFAADEANVDRMREWGLAEAAPVPPSPIKVEVTNPAPQDNKPA